ncbi:hypothetical protein Tco_0988460 [Tanacetum coccineum]|uniref:Uncharacterized protein n=1 Tax=Tanacetum coccineum TaxID=301880 RepID=A0ABQ5EQZ1_9ASTR
MKARGTLLMALLNKDQLKFYSYKDAKLLMEAIEKSINEANNTAYGVSAAHTQSNPTSGDNLSDAVICAFLASQPNSPQILGEDIEQIDPDDLEEMDLQWEMAMLTIRPRRFFKRTGRQLDVNGQRVGFNSQVIDKFKTRLGYNTTSSTAATPAVESFVNSSEMLENHENNKSKYDKGYHAVPPPFIRNFIPRKPDLTFMDEIVESENMDVTIVVTPSNVKTVESNLESAGVKSNGDAIEPKTVRKNNFRPPVIEDWNSDDKNEVEIIPKDKTVSSSTTKIKFVKTARETVEKVETSKQNKHYPRGKPKTGNKDNELRPSACWATHNRSSTRKKELLTARWFSKANVWKQICYLTTYEDYDGGFVSFGDGKGR